MRFDNISITLPPGYSDSLNQESARYGFNRSEFVRVLFDAYLTVAGHMILDGRREPRVDERGLQEFFPDVLPHRKAEAEVWLDQYLRLVIRIAKEREELKRNTGSVEKDSIY